jgi:hypothetical protein
MQEDRPRPRDEKGPGGNDLPPSGEEARAQRMQTIMPLVWLALGIVVIAVFVLLLATRSPRQAYLKGPSAEPVPAPAAPPPKQIVQ